MRGSHGMDAAAPKAVTGTAGAGNAKGVFYDYYHNLSAMFADRSLKVTQVYLDKNMEKLSSGLRINRAGDDASGLAVSEKMRSQIRGLNQAS
ncbi:MAG: flagellin, partial [Treponema sp.]|nr:flagellin [Treponema sp.]